MSPLDVYITGSSGFIANNLMKSLSKYKHLNITGISFGDNKRVNNILYTDYKNLNWIRDQIDLNKDIIVIHTAAYIPQNNTELLDKEILNINSVINNFIVNVFQGLNVKKFIYFSSIAVYGYGYKNLIDVRESEDLLIKNYYAEAKLSGEKMIKDRFGDVSIILRLSSPYGLNKKNRNILENIFLKVINGEKVYIYGEGKRSQDYIYIKDICDVIYKIIKLNIKSNIYNLASGHSFPLINITNKLINNLNSSSKIENLDLPETYSVSINNNKLKTVLDQRFYLPWEGLLEMKKLLLRS